MTHSYERHDSFIPETWLIHMRDMTHSYERHDSFIWETWLIHMRDMTHSYQRHDSFIWETWLIPTQDIPYSYERHDSFIGETWLIHRRDMTHSYTHHNIHTTWPTDMTQCDFSFVCQTWLMSTNLSNMRDMTHCPWVSVTWKTWLIHRRDMTHFYTHHHIHTTWPADMTDCDFSFACQTWLMSMNLIHMKDMTYSYERHDSFIWEIWLIYMFIPTHILLSPTDMTHSNVGHDSCSWTLWKWKT